MLLYQLKKFLKGSFQSLRNEIRLSLHGYTDTQIVIYANQRINIYKLMPLVRALEKNNGIPTSKTNNRGVYNLNKPA